MPAFVTPIIDTAIGLVVTYIAFSLFASWLGEQFSTILSVRSNTLVKALVQMLEASASSPGGADAMSKLFLSNPIFTSLKKNPKSNPQYLSAQQFSNIVLGILNPPTNPPQTAAASLAAIQQAAKNLGVDGQINPLLAKANGDYTVFVKALEDWFDDHMDRVSGWYKVNAQKILLGIGLALALLWNVDSLRIARALSCNAAIRASSVAIGQNPTANPAFVSSVIDAVPVGWQVGGGQYVIWERATSCDKVTSEPKNDLAWWVMKIAGLLITGVALSLGAPFWFDVLSQLTRVRQAGKKPDGSNPSTAS
jgi:hypothetical protein